MKPIRLTLVQCLVIILLATALLTVGGFGCNTAHGFGKDVEAAGQGIQNGTN